MKVNTPYISLCMPLYNGEEFLKESIDSVVNQSYQNIEILVVDDGSTDAGPQIISEYSKKDSRIKLLRNEQNLGLVGNWNRCISLAKGEWIKFQFQDDIMQEDALEKMMNCALDWEVNLVITDRKYIEGADSNKETLKKYARIKRLSHFVKDSRKVSVADMSEFASENYLEYNFIGEPILGLLHRDLISRYGFFDDTFSQLVDLEYWLRISTNEPIGFINEELHTFRIHRNSQSTKNNNVRGVRPGLLDRVILLEKMRDDSIYETFRQNLYGTGNFSVKEWVETGFSIVLCKVGYFHYKKALGKVRIPKKIYRNPMSMALALFTDLSKKIERIFS